MSTQAVFAVAYGLIIAELFSLILKRYPAIRTASRWAVIAAVAVSFAGGCVLLYLDSGLLAGFTDRRFRLPLFFALERSIYAGYAACILFVSLFLVWFPIPLPRNVIVHSMLFVYFFLCRVVSLFFVRLLRDEYRNSVDIALLLCSIVGVLLWTVLLKPAGEKVDVVVGHKWNLAEEERLLTRLQGINAALARASQQ